MIVAPRAGMTVDRSWTVRPDAASVWSGRPRDDLACFAGCALRRDPATGRLRGGGLVLELQAAPLALRILRDDARGTLLCADRPTGAWLPRRGGLLHYQLRLPGDRHLGLGDAPGPLDRSGRRLRCRQIDALGYDAEHGGPLYKHAPFVAVVGADGVAGLLYETLADIDLDLGAEHSNYHAPDRHVETSEDGIVLYVLDGPRLRDLIPRLHGLVGHAPLLPRWALGFGFTSMHHADAPDAQRRILEFAREARRRRMPVETLHFGSGYTSDAEGRRNVFTWNRQRFPDLAGLLAELRRLGYRTVANVQPALLTSHPDYGALAAAGAFVTRPDGEPATARFWGGIGAALDFTDPAARAWWQERLDRDVLAAGFDGVWNDNNEMELADEAARLDGDGHPLPAMAVRPLQALLMTRASRAAQLVRSPGALPYCVSRAGPVGIGALAETWSGDNATSWHSLRWHLVQSLSMSLSGMPLVGHDVGGFTGPRPGPELLVRFFELMALHPRAVMNSWNTDGSGATTPWMHPEVEDAVRATLELRLRFRPLLAALCLQAHREGHPVLAPPAYWLDEAPVDPAPDCFMAGPDLLVAPVLAPGRDRRIVRLPPGTEWHDFHGGGLYRGGTTVELDAPLGRLPLLVRAGAVLPLADGPDAAPPTLHLWPGKADGRSIRPAFWAVERDRPAPAPFATELVWTPEAAELSLPVASVPVLRWHGLAGRDGSVRTAH